MSKEKNVLTKVSYGELMLDIIIKFYQPWNTLHYYLSQDTSA